MKYKWLCALAVVVTMGMSLFGCAPKGGFDPDVTKGNRSAVNPGFTAYVSKEEPADKLVTNVYMQTPEGMTEPRQLCCFCGRFAYRDQVAEHVGREGRTGFRNVSVFRTDVDRVYPLRRGKLSRKSLLRIQ